LEESRLFIIRSLGIVKCETPKSRKQEIVSDTGSWGCQEFLLTGVLKWQKPKLRNAKSRKVKDSIPEVQIPGVGDVKDSHDRNPEVAK
jgi:hypothetical protein